ncbi:radical SAM protein [Nonomuraea sp. NPDC050547]|uniref:radical SAM protein n=1 Tax=Nonomuraea sp. NPDC050547 TaxID=3364368 RepID=UPI0037B82F38
MKDSPPAARPPQLIYFKLFDNCNLRCNMCDCWELPKNDRPPAHYLSLLGEILSAPPEYIRFTGGEPLMYRRLPELISIVAEHGTRPSVISNGLLVSRRLDSLIAAGLAEIVLSLDGVGGVHEDIRGVRNSFERIKPGIDAIARSDLVWGVNTVVQSLNIEHLAAMASMFAELSAPPTWWHLIPVRGHDLLAPSPAQKAAFDEALDSLAARCRSLGTRLVAAKQEHHASPCQVPEFTVYVDGVSGEVYGCNMLAYTDRSWGSLLERRWPDVFGSSRAAGVKALCGTGRHGACAGCDDASREMNLFLRNRIEALR